MNRDKGPPNLRPPYPIRRQGKNSCGLHKTTEWIKVETLKNVYVCKECVESGFYNKQITDYCSRLNKVRDDYEAEAGEGGDNA